MSAKRSRVSGSDAIQREASRMIERGMPNQLAYAVAQGKISLNDALQSMANTDRVERIAAKHDLSRAVATQVVLGQLDLASILRKRRFSDYKTREFDRSILSEALASGQTLVLGLHGSEQRKVSVTDVLDFEVVVTDQKGAENTIKKLSIKYGYVASDWKTAGKSLKKSRAKAEGQAVPIVKPQDRFRCSDKRLFSLMDEQQPVRVQLLEGEEIRGVVSWVSRYEFGLRVKGDAEIIVFRHALSGLWPDRARAT